MITGIEYRLVVDGPEQGTEYVYVVRDGVRRLAGERPGRCEYPPGSEDNPLRTKQWVRGEHGELGEQLMREAQERGDELRVAWIAMSRAEFEHPRHRDCDGCRFCKLDPDGPFCTAPPVVKRAEHGLPVWSKQVLDACPIQGRPLHRHRQS